MQWVTREHPKIDRIACPWLIRRFIEPEAEFLYVPTDQVFAVAAETGAVPYDIPGAEPFAHDGASMSDQPTEMERTCMQRATLRAASSLRSVGTSAADLDGVIAHWIELGVPTCREVDPDTTCSWAPARPTSTTTETML